MDSDWSRPSNHDQLLCSYFPGLDVEIRRHRPPVPFGGQHYPRLPRGRRLDEDEYFARRATQTDVILRYPPLETDNGTEPPLPLPSYSTTPSYKLPGQRARLTITKSLAIGNSRGAQVVLCIITPSKPHHPPFKAVAKIYDSLYYPFTTRHASGSSDVSYSSDSEYSIEAAAYEQLRTAGLTGSFAPEYFGSWTFTLPIQQNRVVYYRPVRLILIEALDGCTIEGLKTRNSQYEDDKPNCFHLTEKYRLDVLTQVMDGKTRMSHASVHHRADLPKHFMIVEEETLSWKPPRASVTPGPVFNRRLYMSRPAYEKDVALGSCARRAKSWAVRKVPKPEKLSIPIERPQPHTRVVLFDYKWATVYKWSTWGLNLQHQPSLPLNPLMFSHIDMWRELRGFVPDAWNEKNGEREFRKWAESVFGGKNRARYAPMPRKT